MAFTQTTRSALRTIGPCTTCKRSTVRDPLHAAQDFETDDAKPDISNFDPASFFSLHDFNNDGVWTPDEVRRTYGLDDESLKNTPADKKDQGILDVFKIFDPYNTGVITRNDWVKSVQEGKKLPDLGMGPGHHGDDEYEYEIHHFELYHDENTREEDLVHPEDIEHFKKHDMMEDQAERVLREQQQVIVERNIPRKFLRQA
jgi:Ca2+-binding EF-hand superfamily protein